MKKLLLTLISAGFLAGVSAPVLAENTDLRAKITRPQETVITYFNSDWEATDKPVRDGYFRKLYGTTADKHYIAQDFYQDTKTKQTDPFEIIDEAGLKSGDNSHNTGAIVWYDKDGKKTNMAVFKAGQPTGEFEDYYPNGKLKQKSTIAADGNRTLASFYENGNKLGLLTANQDGNPQHLQAWHPNGTLANDMTVANGKGKVKGWNENGKALSEEDAAAQLVRFIETLKAVSGE